MVQQSYRAGSYIEPCIICPGFYHPLSETAISKPYLNNLLAGLGCEIHILKQVGIIVEIASVETSQGLWRKIPYP